MPPLAPSSDAESEGLIVSHLHVRGRDLPGNQGAHQALLLGDASGGADYFQAILVHDPIILVKDLPLKQPEALDGIVTPAQIHPRFIELELDAPRHQTVERDV